MYDVIIIRKEDDPDDCPAVCGYKKLVTFPALVRGMIQEKVDKMAVRQNDDGTTTAYDAEIHDVYARISGKIKPVFDFGWED